MSYPYLIQNSNIVIVIDNKPHTIGQSHIAYNQLLDAIKNEKWDAIPSLVDSRSAIVEYGEGEVTIVNDRVLWNGTEMHGVLSDRLIEMMRAGFNIDPLKQFMKNVMQNPSARARNELYKFIEVGNMPITPDGHFLAYKKINSDYYDCHTGTIDNSVGNIITMNRDLVVDDPSITCASGLHFCSMNYLKSFGGDRIVIVKINPRDVVSIPNDYNMTKGRCCRYEVIGEIENTNNIQKTFVDPVQENGNNIKPIKPNDPEIKQDYDKNGRPLSMTPNAIRKRQKRAEQRNTK